MESRRAHMLARTFNRDAVGGARLSPRTGGPSPRANSHPPQGGASGVAGGTHEVPPAFLTNKMGANVRRTLLSTAGATLIGGFVLGSALTSVSATADDPAVVEVRFLCASLLKSMRAGRSESMTDRYRLLKPVIEQAFALPLMTRLSVGPEWTKFSAQQQQGLVIAFSRYTIANYAHNFRSFDGQNLTVDGKAARRGAAEVVRASLVGSNESPANLLYLMEKVNGAWKIIDVYYDGVSQLALHRADFANAIGSGGAPVLIEHLNKVSGDLMK